MTDRKTRHGPRDWKAAGRRLLFPVAETAWALGFALAGRLLHPQARIANPTGRDRVLVLAPHPDDETLGCGGTILRHRRAGDTVTALIVTDGGSSRAGGLQREQMRALRAREAEGALARLDATPLVQLGLPENRWTEAELATQLTCWLEQLQPALIYTTSAVDFHPEHRRVAAVLAGTLAAGAAPACRAVRAYELQVPLTPLLVNRLVDIRAEHARKWHALAAYTTQRASFRWLPRHTEYLRRLYRQPGPCEAFWEMTPAAFCRLMAAAADADRWRSIRLRPFTDGLAWIVGWPARRRLAAAARDP